MQISTANGQHLAGEAESTPRPRKTKKAACMAMRACMHATPRLIHNRIQIQPNPPHHLSRAVHPVTDQFHDDLIGYANSQRSPLPGLRLCENWLKQTTTALQKARLAVGENVVLCGFFGRISSSVWFRTLLRRRIHYLQRKRARLVYSKSVLPPISFSLLPDAPPILFELIPSYRHTRPDLFGDGKTRSLDTSLLREMICGV
jgi:hypothetical protein